METNLIENSITNIATGSPQIDFSNFSNMDTGSFFLGFAIAYVIVFLAIVWFIVWKLIAFWRSARDNNKLWYILFIFIHTFGILEIIYIYFISPNSSYQIKKKARLEAQAQNIHQNTQQNINTNQEV